MFLVIKKSKIIIVAVLIAMIVVSVVLTFEGVHVASANAEKKLVPIYAVDTADKYVALSFDAAWGGDKTAKILDLLDTYEVKATFFLVGFWIDKYPDLVKEIASRGHLIANHSTNHPHFNKLSAEEMRLEIGNTNNKLLELTGSGAKYFRAPFGEYNNTMIGILKDLEMQCIQWDVDSLDWKGISAKEIAERILTRVKCGSIILCHNNSDYIVEALPLVLLGLKSKGLTSVRMDELVYNSNYYIDNNGIQHSN